ncbi:MAG: S41 family peptidase [Chloroflexi bacterium]|nr:S41 family peptidase [Chloroflexota bacterium]
MFPDASVAGETIVAAMNFLAYVDALIIDLRQCLGGEPNPVALAISYLFDSEPVHLNSLYLRSDDRTQQFWTPAYVPGKRLVEIPVYLLISRATFSGRRNLPTI